MGQVRCLTDTEFFRAFLAAYILVDGNEIKGRPTAIHRSFKHGFDETVAALFPDIDLEYDSLHTVSRWLARAIAEGSQDMIIACHPHRDDCRFIYFTTDQARRILAESGYEEELIALATVFRNKVAESAL